MWEFLSEILGILALFVIVGLCLIAKSFWDRLGKRIQQSAVGNWYKKRPWKWQATLSIVSIISLLFLFWCVCVYGVIILLGFVYASNIVYASVLVSFPFFGFLILGACWSISERLQREGIDKPTIQIGFPLIAFVILILLLIAVGVTGLVIGTILTGTVIGMTYFITMHLFIRAGKLRMELARKSMELVELKDQLGRGAITQEEYEQKKNLLESEKPSRAMLMLSKELKLTAIFGVIVAITAVMLCLFPLGTLLVSFAILLIASVPLVPVTLYFGWKHPKLYVRLYTFLVAVPVVLICGCCTLVHIAYIFPALTPLLPLWYLWYRGYRKEKGLFWWYRK